MNVKVSCFRWEMILCFLFISANSISQKQPNFIIIFADDLGYGDLSCYGSRHKTPNIDKLATQGVRFTDFYTSSSVCTPSRSSLLTGCYAQRIDMHMNAKGECVLFPAAHKGLNPDEITIAEILKDQGYATACIGKWHLGDQIEFLPTNHGFDYYYGIPYSNDHNREHIPLPLMRNEKVIEAPVHQNNLTKRYTKETIDFITDHKDEPFFVYLPHTFPHYPLHASGDFLGNSGNGTYGDAIEEIDWSTGEIVKALYELNLDKNTLIIFTSDNGADYYYGGNNMPLYGQKGDTWEGGQRVPFIAWMPGVIPMDQISNELATAMDILPTFTALAKGELPCDRKIDGKNIMPLMTKPTVSKSPHKVFFYYQIDQLQAVRYGKWKLFIPLENKRQNWGSGLGKTAVKLYDLEKDPQEIVNLASDNASLVKEIMVFAEQAREELGDYKKIGKGRRTAGFVQNPKPLLLNSDN